MKKENGRCHWAENEHGNWFTGCDRAFSVDYGSPHDNDMTFCPFCGGRLTEHKYTFTTSSDAAETPPVAQSPATESPSGWLNNSEAAGGEYSDAPETDAIWGAYYAGDADNADVANMMLRMERERDQYAAMLCDAMRWVYVCCVTNQNRADMIDRFEALELTPANSLKNETSPLGSAR
jgi:hypothetical protein